MKIGIDIDEVLNDFMNPFIRFHNKEYGTRLKRDDFKTFNLWETLGGTKEKSSKKIYDFFHSKFYEEIIPIEGSQESINILSKDNDLVIITSRPEYIKNKTIQSIEKYFPNYFNKIYFTHEWSKNGRTRKKDICFKEKVNVLIEDSLDKTRECVSDNLKILLYDCPWNQTENLPENIIRVNNWDEILNQFNLK